MRSTFGAVTIVMALAAQSTLAAPPSVDRTITGAIDLSSGQKDTLRKFADYWCGTAGLASSQATDVDKSRNQLLRPLSNIKVTAAFRDEYSRVLCPRLESLILKAEAFNAVNALQVLAELGTSSSLDTLSVFVEHKTVAIRLWSAIGIRLTIGGNVISGNNSQDRLIEDRRIIRALRNVQAAIEEEKDWWVMHRQFDALAVAGSHESRELEVQALRHVIDRMAEKTNEPSKLMLAVDRELISIRARYTTLQVTDVEQIGKKLGPVLGRVLEVATTHWDKAQEDEEIRASYGRAVKTSEMMLKYIDGAVRQNSKVPSTNIYAHWQRRNRSQFKEDTQLWMGICHDPPYQRH